MAHRAFTNAANRLGVTAAAAMVELDEVQTGTRPVPSDPNTTKQSLTHGMCSWTRRGQVCIEVIVAVVGVGKTATQCELLPSFVVIRGPFALLVNQSLSLCLVFVSSL
jgi:hypothetical protein